MAAPDRVVLVDGSSLIFRAYYAIPANLRTASGMPTNAIFGFAGMFRKLFAAKSPALGAVVFDAPGPTFREERYEAYKAQRPPMPSDLRAQLPWIDKLVSAHNFPILRIPGYEADDVIGTLTRQAVDAGHEVTIVAGDKDFAQLIGPRVRMVDTLRDVTYDPDLVRKKWGVRPEQIIDYLALVGDKVDNVPGVPGIGAKGASDLLGRYGDLEGILTHLEELKGRQQQSLREHRELAHLCRELVTIDTQVPLEQGVASLVVQVPETASLNALYTELQFYSLLSEDAAAALSSVGDDTDYQLVATVEELAQRLSVLRPAVPVALWPIYDEGSSLSPLLGLALALGSGEAFYVPLRGYEDGLSPALALLKPWLEASSALKVVYDTKRLRVLLAPQGVALAGVIADPRLESFLVDPTALAPHRIDQLVKAFLQRTLPAAKTILGRGKKAHSFAEIEPAVIAPWACQYADTVLNIWPQIRTKLEAIGQLDHLIKVELPISEILASMELAGVRVDAPELEAMSLEFKATLAQLEVDIWAHAGREFNVASPKQLGVVLFEEMGLPVIKRTKTGYSTAADVLERLRREHPIAELLLQHRKLAKLLSTYTDVLRAAVNPATGRVHASFQQTYAATGRLISTDPDIQKTPVRTPEGRRIRCAFIPAEGWRLISADWSQIELRLLAHFSADESLVEAFATEQDVHRRTASELFSCEPEAVSAEQRAIAKTVNFATIYGQGATALGQSLGLKRKEAKAYIDRYFEVYAGVRRWLDHTIEQALSLGYVETLLGRRRLIPELSSNSAMVRQVGMRMAANTPIQGSAADLCKLAMLGLRAGFERQGLKTRMLLQIHDELVFECLPDELDESCQLIKQVMEGVGDLRVPLRVQVGVGANWAEAH